MMMLLRKSPLFSKAAVSPTLLLGPSLTTRAIMMRNQHWIGLRAATMDHLGTHQRQIVALQVMPFAKKGKDSNRQDKKKAQEKAQIYEEFEGQDLDSVKSDFDEALEVSLLLIPALYTFFALVAVLRDTG